MACGGCERRRRALEKKKAQKAARGQRVQAAGIGAVLKVTQAMGAVLGLTTEATDDQEKAQPHGPEATPVAEPSPDADVGGGEGAEPDR